MVFAICQNSIITVMNISHVFQGSIISWILSKSSLYDWDIISNLCSRNDLHLRLHMLNINHLSSRNAPSGRNLCGKIFINIRNVALCNSVLLIPLGISNI